MDRVVAGRRGHDRLGGVAGKALVEAAVLRPPALPPAPCPSSGSGKSGDSADGWVTPWSQPDVHRQVPRLGTLPGG